MPPNDKTFPAGHILSNDSRQYLCAHSDNIKVRMVNSGLPFCGSAGKESACNAGDLGSIPGLGRSPGEGNGYPLQYSGLENSMDCTVHGVTKSRTQLSDFHFQSTYRCSWLAWNKCYTNVY